MRIGLNIVPGDTMASGAGRFLKNIVEAVKCVGEDHEFIFFHDSPECWRDYQEIPHMCFYRVPLPRGSGRMRHAFGCLYWPLMMKKYRLDVFHHPYPPVARSKTSRIILTVHDLRFMHFPETYHPLRLAWLKATMKNSLNHADKILTVSEVTKNDILTYAGIPSEKIDVLYHGVDFKPSRNKTLSLPEPFVLYMGHFEKRKNVINLVRAFKNLKNKIPHHLLLVGQDRGELSKLEAYVSENGLQATVTFMGPVEDKRLEELYTRADLLVMPSVHEGFGLTVIEALACGTLAAASDISVFREILKNRKLLFDPLNPESIADRIHDLIHRKGLLQNMAGEICSRFSMDRFSSELMKCYERAYVL